MSLKSILQGLIILLIILILSSVYFNYFSERNLEQVEFTEQVKEKKLETSVKNHVY